MFFSPDKVSGQNQRTLPFNVDILDLPAEKRVHMGSSSKTKMGSSSKNAKKTTQFYSNKKTKYTIQNLVKKAKYTNLRAWYFFSLSISL